MDKRLPHRIREVRLKLVEEGKSLTSEIATSALVKTYPEYARTKRPALRRFVAQELTSISPSVSRPDECDDVGKKRKHDGNEEGDAQSGEVTALNGSLRKLYQPDPPEPKNDSTKPPVKSRAARERARAAARKDAGLGEPASSSQFQPEERPEDRLDDLGGIDTILAELKQLVVYPLTHPEVFTHLGVQAPTGVLLHGPPGSGKTKLAHALAGSIGVSFFKVAATEIVSGMSGESEAKIRQLFQATVDAAPSLLFLDEVDSITPRRDTAGREMERRIVAQLLTCMDELQNKFVIVLGATNRPDALDPALRRAGRFDREIAMGIPDEPARMRILSKMSKGIRLAGDLDLPLLARLTPGFVGADLSALTKEAALNAVTRAFSSLGDSRLFSNEGPPEPYSEQELADLAVEMSDFHVALTRVQPSALREGFATVPNVSWDDVGALAEVRAELDSAVCEPIRKADLFREWGLTVPVGVLLFGPPGCGKTLIAKAAANASGANFISIKGPELLNKYVGESERAVRLVFQRAISSAPCVIFFDELDALVPKRSAEGSGSSERVVNQMLTEMDGAQQRSQVFVIAATNRPDILDPAMLRPGRLDRLLYVPLPSEAGRLEILQTHAKKLPLADDVHLEGLASGCEGFSGADLAALVRETAYLAIREADLPGTSPRAIPEVPKEGDEASPQASKKTSITANDFARARSRVSASVGAEERREYEALSARLKSGRS